MAYDKHEWETDEIITAALLNNIEDGIEAVDLALEDKQDVSTALQIGTTASTAMAGNTVIPTIPATLPPTDGSVTNAKVATGAAIALNKLANIAAGTDGLSAGTIQATFQALATRIQALEDAAE